MLSVLEVVVLFYLLPLRAREVDGLDDHLVRRPVFSITDLSFLVFGPGSISNRIEVRFMGY